MKVIAIIPARGGSKGVYKKNIKELAGEPLISYTIKAANESILVNDVYVSSDDDEILKISKNLGAIAIKRPDELSKDDSTSIDAILHILDNLDEKIDFVVLLQATSPFRDYKDLNRAIEKFITKNQEAIANGKEKYDTLISVCEYDENPFWALEMKNDELKPLFGTEYLNMRRQDLKKSYRPNGAIFISSPEYLKNEKTFYGKRTLGFLMDQEKSIDIDTEADFKVAEFLME